MNCLFGLVLLLCGIERGLGCTSARIETYKCLADFFNDTSQRVPPALERKLLQAEPSRVKRDDSTRSAETETVDDGFTTAKNESGRQADRRQSPRFKNHWCGPFEDYVDCMERARVKCERAAPYTCTIMTTFSLMYGTYICGVDIQPWVASDIKSCQALSTSTGIHARPVLMRHILPVLSWLLATERIYHRAN